MTQSIDKLLEEAEIGMDSGEVILTISLSDIPLCSSLVKKASIAPQLAAEVRRLMVDVEAWKSKAMAQEDYSGKYFDLQKRERVLSEALTKTVKLFDILWTVAQKWFDTVDYGATGRQFCIDAIGEVRKEARAALSFDKPPIA